jgi:probable HAF family extracellular repeat protein
MEEILMKTYRSVSRIFLLSTLVVVAGVADDAAATPPGYHITDLGTLGGTHSIGYGINASGQVTGDSFPTGVGVSRSHAFLWTPTTPNGASGTMIDLGTLGGTSSYGQGINASGQVAGYAYTDGNDEVYAFLWTPTSPNGVSGTMLPLGTLGGTDSVGLGINAGGQVVGYSSTTGDVVLHAFFYDGSMHDLGTLGGTGESYAYGINDSGQVTGEAGGHAFLYDGTMHDLEGGSGGLGINASGQVTGNSGTHAFLWTPTTPNGASGTLIDLGTLGGGSSSGRGINASGHVVGTSYPTGNTASHAFLYTSGSGMVDLNSLIDPLSGWELTEGNAINDAGQITGIGFNGSELHAFLLTPVPEPATLAMLALGLPLIIWRNSRRLPAVCVASDSSLRRARTHEWLT